MASVWGAFENSTRRDGGSGGRGPWRDEGGSRVFERFGGDGRVCLLTSSAMDARKKVILSIAVAASQHMLNTVMRSNQEEVENHVIDVIAYHLLRTKVKRQEDFADMHKRLCGRNYSPHEFSSIPAAF